MVVVLPGCNSCSFDDTGAAKAALGVQGAVIVTPDDSNLNMLKSSGQASKNWIVVDRRGVVPREVYDHAPLLAHVDGSGTIRSWRRLP